ncbi:MAG: hypothetical protein LC664_12925 [Flavobacteriales bacterium]|nr:hypothetical protein [Flavobacteriales bacterium]
MQKETQIRIWHCPDGLDIDEGFAEAMKICKSEKKVVRVIFNDVVVHIDSQTSLKEFAEDYNVNWNSDQMLLALLKFIQSEK